MPVRPVQKPVEEAKKTEAVELVEAPVKPSLLLTTEDKKSKKKSGGK